MGEISVSPPSNHDSSEASSQLNVRTDWRDSHHANPHSLRIRGHRSLKRTHNHERSVCRRAGSPISFPSLLMTHSSTETFPDGFMEWRRMLSPFPCFTYVRSYKSRETTSMAASSNSISSNNRTALSRFSSLLGVSHIPSRVTFRSSRTLGWELLSLVMLSVSLRIWVWTGCTSFICIILGLRLRCSTIANRDIDFEYPASASDQTSFASLFTELRTAFNALAAKKGDTVPYQLTVSLSSSYFSFLSLVFRVRFTFSPIYCPSLALFFQMISHSFRRLRYQLAQRTTPSSIYLQWTKRSTIGIWWSVLFFPLLLSSILMN